VSIVGEIDSFDAAEMATVATAKPRQMPQLVAYVLVGVPERIGGSPMFRLSVADMDLC
jgi:hypothetical protein